MTQNTPETDAADKKGQARTALIVDDSPMDRMLASSLLQNLGVWNVLEAGNGVEALAVLENAAPDIVITDLLMPEMDGLELVRSVRSSHPLIPVILMTGHGSEDVAIRALQSGAASYVPKKSLARDLAETLDQVLAASRAGRDQRRLVQHQTHLEAHFVLGNDPSLIPPLVHYLEEGLSRMHICEPSGLVLLGVALHEALSNAIFHGNLEVSSTLRESDEGLYYKTAEARRREEPWRERSVYITVRMSRLEAAFIVRDEGKGFDPTALPNPTDPANLEKVSGRGLLLIQTFMDRVDHNETGNQITMTKRRYR